MIDLATCIPCQAKIDLEQRKLKFLRENAKKRAIQQNKNFCIYFDDEDKRYCTTEEETAEREGFEILEIISRYS